MFMLRKVSRQTTRTVCTQPEHDMAHTQSLLPGPWPSRSMLATYAT